MSLLNAHEKELYPLFGQDVFEPIIGPSEPFLPTLGNPVVHANDPSTSRAAAVAHSLNGRRAKHAKIVLGLVVANPGLTAVELYHQADENMKAELKEMQEVRRRLTDLLAAGFVYRQGQRQCTIKRTTQVVWFPVSR